MDDTQMIQMLSKLSEAALTKREQFALAVYAAILENSAWAPGPMPLADAAVKLADDLIAALKK